MRSPFPGMDPFLEVRGLWEGFHTKLIAALEVKLSELVPRRYIVDIGERFYVVLAVGDEEKRRGGQTDVNVSVPRGEWTPGNAPESTVAVAEPGDGPVAMRAFIEEAFREHFVEIREASRDERLVTTIEVLSPTNKRFGTEGWRLYLRKRQGCIESDACNFVEIDVLRGGQRMPMRDAWPASPYYVLVNRRGQGSRCQVWPAASLRPVPPIPVPLLPPDSDVLVPFQDLVDAVYERSRYAQRVDYHALPQPQLSSDETAWLTQSMNAAAGPPVS